jgi:Transposase DDE domain
VHHLRGRPVPQATEYDAALRAACAAWSSDPGLRQDYAQHRPHVERVIAQAAHLAGRRLKLRYRGVAKNHAWLKRRTAALNLRNLAGKGPYLRKTRLVWCYIARTGCCG